MLFLAVVNIVELRSQLVLCGPGERLLALDVRPPHASPPAALRVVLGAWTDCGQQRVRGAVERARVQRGAEGARASSYARVCLSATEPAHRAARRTRLCGSSVVFSHLPPPTVVRLVRDLRRALTPAMPQHAALAVVSCDRSCRGVRRRDRRRGAARQRDGPRQAGLAEEGLRAGDHQGHQGRLVAPKDAGARPLQGPRSRGVHSMRSAVRAPAAVFWDHTLN